MLNKQTIPCKRKQQMIEKIKQILPDWHDTADQQLRVQRLSGITNQIYKVSYPSKHPIIYRQFGDANNSTKLLTIDIFLNRKTQQLIYKYVFNHSMGPKVLGMAQGIRLQEFIQSRTISNAQMLSMQFVQHVAYALRQFHSINTLGQICQESLFSQTFFNHNSPLLTKCLQKISQPIFNELQLKMLDEMKNWVSKQQIQFAKKITRQLQKKELIFSHNDLLPSNILIKKGADEQIIFIDYEYSCYNYPVYDIANYFNQSAINYDFQSPPYFQIIPQPQNASTMRDKFMRYYSQAGGLQYQQYKEKIKNVPQLTPEQNIIYEQLKANLKIGQMMSHIMWGWWGIIVSKNENIQFDYISFSYERYKAYSKIKQQFIIQHKNL